MKYLISKERLVELTVEMISHEIEEYGIHKESGQYQLNNSEGKCVMNYVPNHKELYYDHSLREYVSKFIPLGYDIDTFKEGAKKYFKSQFPDLIVRTVTGANIV